jgi:hypothetical protein
MPSIVAHAVAASGGSPDGGESSSSPAIGPSPPLTELTAKVAAARWIPLRLTEAERSTLRVLEGAPHLYRPGHAPPARGRRGRDKAALDRVRAACTDRALASLRRIASQPRTPSCSPMTLCSRTCLPLPLPTHALEPSAGALLVSEYTDNVDVPSWRMNKSGRIITSLQERRLPV